MEKKKDFWVIEYPELCDSYYPQYYIHSVYASKEEALPIFKEITRECELRGLGEPLLTQSFSYSMNMLTKYESMITYFHVNENEKIAEIMGSQPTEERKEGIEIKDIDPCSKGNKIFYKDQEGRYLEASIDKDVNVYIFISENDSKKEMIEKAMKIMEKEGYKIVN